MKTTERDEIVKIKQTVCEFVISTTDSDQNIIIPIEIYSIKERK